MTEDRLAEIEKRQDCLVAYYEEDAFPDAQDDIDFLIGEVKRLRYELACCDDCGCCFHARYGPAD